jgi:hypothetical protein
VKRVTIRFWHGCRIIGDLSLDASGSTWVTSPEMPNNSNEMPDMEMDPFAELVKLKGSEVRDFLSLREVD